jgi:hypothetical protein
MTRSIDRKEALRLFLRGLRKPKGALMFILFGGMFLIGCYIFWHDALATCGRFGRYVKYTACFRTSPLGYTQGMVLMFFGLIAFLGMTFFAPMAIAYQDFKEEV